MSENEIHQPKCPSCSVVGKEFIIQQGSDEESSMKEPWFNIVHCSECGHVYGIFNKISTKPYRPNF